MGIVLLSQTRSLRKALRDVNDLLRLGYSREGKYMTTEEVARERSLRQLIKEAGFALERVCLPIEGMDDGEGNPVYDDVWVLRYAPYPKGEDSPEGGMAKGVRTVRAGGRDVVSEI